MKQATSPKQRNGLRKAYRFDYGKARPNRFAARMAGASVVIVLDPDVASVFRTSRAVNTALRTMISSREKRLGASSAPKRRAV